MLPHVLRRVAIFPNHEQERLLDELTKDLPQLAQAGAPDESRGLRLDELLINCGKRLHEADEAKKKDAEAAAEKREEEAETKIEVY